MAEVPQFIAVHSRAGCITTVLWGVMSCVYFGRLAMTFRNIRDNLNVNTHSREYLKSHEGCRVLSCGI
jgi:hypothetical protein